MKEQEILDALSLTHFKHIKHNNLKAIKKLKAEGKIEIMRSSRKKVYSLVAQSS